MPGAGSSSGNRRGIPARTSRSRSCRARCRPVRTRPPAISWRDRARTPRSRSRGRAWPRRRSPPSALLDLPVRHSRADGERLHASGRGRRRRAGAEELGVGLSHQLAEAFVEHVLHQPLDEITPVVGDAPLRSLGRLRTICTLDCVTSGSVTMLTTCCLESAPCRRAPRPPARAP